MNITREELKYIIKEFIRDDILNEGPISYTVKSIKGAWQLVNKKSGKTLKQKYMSKDAAQNALKAMGSVAKSTMNKVKPKSNFKISSTMDVKMGKK